MNGVHVLGEKKEERVDIFEVEKKFKEGLNSRNEFIGSCSPQELYEREQELRREEMRMLLEVMIGVVKYLAQEKRDANQRLFLPTH